MPAGRLSEHLRFYRRQEVDDGAGNRRGAWVFQFAAWADMHMRGGSEAFTAARMEGRVVFSVRIRRNPDSEQLRQDWMAKDSRDAQYTVVAPSFDPRDRSMMAMTLMARSGSVVA